MLVYCRYSPGDLEVVAGSTKLNQGGQYHNVAKLFFNENFDPYEIINDVGLIKLATPLTFNDAVQPIALETDFIPGGEDTVLCGWGMTSLDPALTPNDLQYIFLKVISVKECQEREAPFNVYESEICTFTEFGEGACYGDSGGPLVTGGKVAGIVSWGRPCAAGYPDVFTRVSSFVDWIQDVIENN